MPGAVFRRGDRVTLRTVEREDADFVQRGHNDPAVGVALGLDRPENHDSAEDHVQQFEDDPNVATFLVCVDGDDEDADPTLVGKVTVKHLHHTRPELSYWVLPEHQGNDYGTEAARVVVEYVFDAREVRGLQAQAFAPNEGSVGVLENLGFTHEGTLRDARFRDGEYVDVVWYGLLREEWRDDDNDESTRVGGDR